MPPSNITLAITGASGSVYAAEMLRALDADARVAKVNLIVSENGLRVFAEELQFSARSNVVEKILGHPSAKIQTHPANDIGANVASEATLRTA